jgi:hypothetical protein
MKRTILSTALSVFVLILFAQFPTQPVSILNPVEDTIGESIYDLQTNASCQNRIYLFDDGTIGATWTRGMEETTAFNDRGTGYNYYDGSTWQSWPEERIESMRTGWPSYAPYGEGGEIVAAHISGADTIGLLFNKRNIKGSGEWVEFLFTGPAGHELLLWPRMVTGGTDHSNICLIAMTAPVANGGALFQGMDGALLYSRSTDGGETWDIQNQLLPGMDSNLYTGFYRDGYAFAEPENNIVAFVVGSYQSDFFLMKSTDQGQTFTKTIIWDNPYDLVSPTFPTDTFYSVDGSLAVALDNEGMAHVAFGIVKTWYVYYDEGWAFDKLTDGVGYWNETMETFSSNPNALDPSCGPESELVQDVSLIGWTQDLNGNGVMDILGDVTPYSCFYFSMGISSMVQLVIDSQNRLFLVYTSLTESYNDGTRDYRRIWLRSSLDGGQNWGQFYHLDGDDSTSIYTDYAFPSCAAISDEKIYLTFMGDIGAGMYCIGDLCPPDENFIYFTTVPKDEIVGINPAGSEPNFEVSQNFPNPFSESSMIHVNLVEPTELNVDIINLMGQKVAESQYIKGKTGINTIKIERKDLSPGVYFYNVKTDQSSIRHKMIIE